MQISINNDHEDYLIVNNRKIYIPKELRASLLDEHNKKLSDSAIAQFASTSKLPGLVDAVGLPDFHSGYALPIGSIAAIDLDNKNACISPDGVGFDINCGVRCLKSNLTIKDMPTAIRNKLCDKLISEIPFVGKDGKIVDNTIEKISLEELNNILDYGMKHLVEIGIATNDDMECTESKGSVVGNSKMVPQSAKSRGIEHLGTLGSGNHYLEFQVVENIYNEDLASKMGIFKDQILVSIHTGSRGLGYGCCDSILKEINKNKNEDQKDTQKNLDLLKSEFKKISDNNLLSKEEKQECYKQIKQKYKKNKTSNLNNTKLENLHCVPFHSYLGQKYFSLMNSSSNYAYANRSYITYKIRKCLIDIFPNTNLEIISDVCHNIAKVEEDVNGKRLLVHRKGASRVLPPNHPELPYKYKDIGQPVLIGGSMGTHSMLVVGAENAINTCYSTCHGAGRIVSRSESKNKFDYDNIVIDLNNKDIVFRSASKDGMVEECGQCYKDVNCVVQHSEKVGLTKTVCRVRPILVIKQ